MENPFTIKSYESKELFCDREEELQLMLRNCINSTDMTLISKRRMGKTGLILRLFDELKDVRTDIHTVYFDIFASRNIDDFIKLMAEAAMKSFPEKTSMGGQLLKFIKSLRPQLSFDNITGDPADTGLSRTEYGSPAANLYSTDPQSDFYILWQQEAHDGRYFC